MRIFTGDARHGRGPRAATLLALLIVALLGLSACGDDDDGGDEGSAGSGGGSEQLADEPMTITVGTPAAVFPYLGLYAADELGYLEDEKLTMEVITSADEALCIRGLIAGDIDACPVGVDNAIRAVQNGSDAKILATTADPTVNALNVDPSIKDWEDLEGVNIASQTPSSGSSVAIRAMLAQNGVDPFGAEFLTVGGSTDRFAALQSGRVKAAITSQPQQFLAEAEGYPILGATEGDAAQANFLVGVPGRSEELDEKFRRVIRAMQRTYEWVNDTANREEAIDMFAKIFTGDDRESAEKSYELLVVDRESYAPGVEVSTESIERVAALTEEYTDTEVTVTPEDLVDDQFLP